MATIVRVDQHHNNSARRALNAPPREVCDHPYLFPDAEDDPDETSVEELVGASGKLRVLDRLLVKLHRAGHRVALFSQFAQARPQRSSASRGCGCSSSWDRRFRGASEHASRASGARDRSISTQRVRPRAAAPDRPDAPTPPAPPSPLRCSR